jgi:hypothetical protein
MFLFNPNSNRASEIQVGDVMSALDAVWSFD